MNALRHAGATSFGKALLYVFLLLTCLRVWAGGPSVLPRAEAQIPDAGLQRKMLLDEAAKTNALLAEIKQVLQAQTLNVRVIGADNP
jgi:hypothetical protein